MKGAVVVLTAASALAATACGASGTPRDAHVSGLIRLCGGPLPGRCFTQDGSVSALDSRRHLVASQKTRHARFAFTLPPGAYTLVATTGGTDGQRTVVARSRRAVHADIVIAIS